MNTTTEQALDPRAARVDENTVYYATGECVLGTALVAKSERGICAIPLGDDADELARDLRNRFPRARPGDGDIELEGLVSKVAGFIDSPAMALDVPLDLHGTDFERCVWETLRAIPAGSTATYAEVADRIGAPRQAYAVGVACAANIIAVAIRAIGSCARTAHWPAIDGGSSASERCFSAKAQGLLWQRVATPCSKATLNKSLAGRASSLWAVCGVANPRHSSGYGCGLRLAAHPKSRRAPSRGLVQRRPKADLFGIGRSRAAHAGGRRRWRAICGQASWQRK